MAFFTIETRKSIGGYAWSNTYHCSATDQDTALGAAVPIATFERELLSNLVTLEEVKVAPWNAGQNNAFVIVNIGAAGLRSLAQPLPAPVCLLAKLNAPAGHPGKKWFRLSLQESEVEQVAGKAVLTAGAPIIAAFAAAAGDLDDALASANVTLVIGSIPLTARTSTNLFVINGVGLRQMDVGWYNKTP